MPNLTLSFNTRRPMGLLKPHAIGSEAGRWLIEAVNGALNGSSQASGSDGCIWACEDTTAFGAAANAGPAVAALVGSTLTGTVGATIDGTAVTVTAAGGDVATQALFVAAVKANTSVNRKVTATQRGLQATVGVMTVGQFVDICATRFTGVNGAETDFGQFDISSATAATIATKLAQAINRHPSLAMRVRAVANSTALYVFPTTDRVMTRFESLVNSGGFSTFTIVSGTQTALATSAVLAMVPGVLGECCTIVASGTGATVATANAGKLGAGGGGAATSNFFLP